MKKRFTIIYTIIASLLIAASLGYLGFNLIKEYKEGTSRTAINFNDTKFNLYRVLPEINTNKNDYYEKIYNTMSNVQDFSYFELQKNGNVIFSYPNNSNLDNTTSNFTKYYSSNIDIDENNKYLFTCNLYLLKPYSIYHYAGITFFMILSITLVTIILIIINSIITKKKLKYTDYSETDLNEKNTDKMEDKKNQDIPDDDYIEDYTEEENVIAEELIEKEQDITEKDDYFAKQEEQQANFKAGITRETSETVEDAPAPEGLFSDTTGLGWESYLITRLNNEINRAISTELDMSLFMIKLTNLERTNPLTKKVCDYLTLQFQFRDLLFEYKEDCIVAINTGEDLDDALTFAEKIQNEISKMLINTDSKCFIGISTRSVRMISAETFLKEAEEALSHAEHDGNGPIIAFKANIEKYQKYLEQKFNE